MWDRPGYAGLLASCCMMPNQIDKQIHPDIKRRSVIFTDIYGFVFIDDLVMFTKERLFCQEVIFLVSLY